MIHWDGKDAKGEIKIFSKDDKLIHTISKGEKRGALIFGRIDQSWEIYSRGDLLIKLFEEDDKPEIIGYYLEEDKSKIKFLKTRQHTRDADGNWILVNEITGG